ncbi:asparaginase [Streptosporangium sp. NPDC004379]|uniref:asparaginase n=1 Tax=Streptosporangium sp. NPDC004379 TaxID=3366189 RepID=UPI00369DD704
MGPRIRILTTGGTIASRPAPEGGVSVAVPGHRLVTAAETAVTTEVREVMLEHSFNLTRARMLELAGRIVAEVRDPEVDGVVVTHGTDTMEESAYLLDLLLPPGSTVVFTGAQRHAAEPDGDGPRNIRDAVRVAADPAARGLGALVAMAGLVHAARHATKADTLAPEAFASPGHGPVGRVSGDRVRIAFHPVRPAGFDLAEMAGPQPRVDIVPVHPDADGVQVAACAAAGARGLVVEALGAGNPTPGVLREIRSCVADGVTVLVTSRCARGPVTPVYGAGGGVDLAEAGAVFAGSLRAPKARVLLATALAAEPRPDRALARLVPHLGL